jgi:alkanesulfonate monooxygenase SsuD/methylene tetrahydromethanopterin reductase-like flavin-dependent oxidoreductase (luciferase family)
VSAIAADTAERAEELATSTALGLVRMRQGHPTPLPSPEEGAATATPPTSWTRSCRYRRAQVLGDAVGVRDEIHSLAERTAADEVIVMTMVHDHGERVHTYELIAEALAPAAGTGRTEAQEGHWDAQHP